MRSVNTIPYKLIITSNAWVGSFERELIGYSMGCLDEVQMDIDFASYERALFWDEVYGEDMPRFEFEDNEDYNLMTDFLMETYQTVDDWEQNTFYNVEAGTHINVLKKPEATSCIIIQLAKPLDEHWESIIIPRMKAFFNKKIYDGLKDEDKIVSLCLIDAYGNIIKDYMSDNTDESKHNICKYTKLVPKTFVSIDGVDFDYNILYSTLDLLTCGNRVDECEFASGDVIEKLCKLGYVVSSYGSHQALMYCEKESGMAEKLIDEISSVANIRL